MSETNPKGQIEDKDKEVKVTLFGILAGTKALLNPVKNILEVSKQRLEVEKQQTEALISIRNSLQIISVSQKAIAQNMLRTARALNDLNYKTK